MMNSSGFIFISSFLFSSLFVLVVHSTFVADWVPTAGNSYEATVCGCAHDFHCTDRPWITWGFIAVVETEDPKIQKMYCVILDNRGDFPAQKRRLSSPEKKELFEPSLLKRYFDYHIYYNDTEHVRNNSNVNSTVIFVIDVEEPEKIYFPSNRTMAEKAVNEPNVLRLYLTVLRKFWVFTKQYVDNERTIEYTYKGPVEPSTCCDNKRRIEVKSLSQFLNL